MRLVEGVGWRGGEPRQLKNGCGSWRAPHGESESGSWVHMSAACHICIDHVKYGSLIQGGKDAEDI